MNLLHLSQSERGEYPEGKQSPEHVPSEEVIPDPTKLVTDPPPDGGLRAWSQVFVGHLIVTLAWGYPSSFGVFQAYYEETLPQSPSDISWIGGVQVFILLFISIFSGRAADAGLTRQFVLAGSLLLLLGTFATSWATQYWHIFLAQGVCVGVSLGLMWLPSLTLISHYFVRKRVLALTIASTGTSTGGMIFPAMVQHLTPRIGFPWAVRCMGFLVLFMLIIINLLLRTRLPPRTSGPLVEWSAFTEPAFLLFTFGVFLLYWALYFAFFYIQVYASQKLGFDNISGVNLIIIINAAGMPARAPCGYLADRYLGPLNVLIPWVALCGIVVFCWAAVEDAADLYVFAVIYGVASAAAMGLFAGTVPSLTKDISKIGTRMGMVLTLISLGPLTGPSVAGALVAKTGGNYLAAQIWAGTSLLLAAVLLVAARLYTTGWHLKVKV